MLIELVRRTAVSSPDRPIVVSPGDDLTYAECLSRAERVAVGLAKRGLDRVGCALQTVQDSIVLLVASSAVGCEACLYPPGSGDGDIERLASRFDHDAVVADHAGELGKAVLITVDQLVTDEGQTGNERRSAPVLILTTGTTGEQKGVPHDWTSLCQAARRISDGPDSRWLLAFNLNQFAGLQVLLHALVNRGTLVELQSRAPDDVILTIRRNLVTHASATPTFWRLVAGRLTPTEAQQLPLAQITLGGEAASEELLTRLGKLFPDARISHVYAGTEFGSIVSVRDGHAGLPLTVLERASETDAQLRIVDGELQVRPGARMSGYYGGRTTASDWYPTGDLVEIREGRIHFVGRKTDIINVGGAKVHPLPVEEAVCSVEGVRLAAAYGRANAIAGQILVVDVVPQDGVDRQRLESRIRKACSRLPSASRPRRIRFVSEIPTLGDKVTRRGTPDTVR